MPAIELTLTDTQDQPVLRRVLTPADTGRGRRRRSQSAPSGAGTLASRGHMVPARAASPVTACWPSIPELSFERRSHGCLICGSLAFDTIITFPGRFAEQILPDQLHILNVSFLVPTLRREFGGCAGNIAYTLQAAGRRAAGDGGAGQRRRELSGAPEGAGHRPPISVHVAGTTTPRRPSSSPTRTTTRSPPSTRAR